MREYGDEYDDLQDDEYYDEFDDDDDIEEDEEDPKKDAAGSSSSRVNPFSGKPSAPDTRASGLPGAGRSPSYGSASRLPGSVGSSRPESGSPPGGTGSSGARPFGSGGSSLPPSSGASGARSFGSGGSSPPPSSGASGARSFGSGGSSPPPSSGASGARSFGSGGSSPPAGSPPKKDEPAKPAPGGKLLGSLTSRIGGDKDKKDAGKGGLGRFTSGLMNRGKDAAPSSRPAAPKGDQKGGSVLGRLPFGKSGAKKPAAPPSSASSSPYDRPASPPSSGSSSPLGKPASSPPSSSASAPRFGSAASRPLGSAGSGAAAKPAPRKGLFGFFQGGKKDDKKPAPKPRQSKAPKVEQGAGLSLDNKLDILGVVLVLGSLALFFSSLSTTKGALTEAVNTFLANLLGWGAVAIPLVMLAIGVWLIARHFGDEAPVVERMRIIGMFMLYLGVLILLQFIDAFSYEGVSNLSQLRVQLELSWTFGRGGGWLGAQLYFLMVSNITEIGAFFVVLGWLIVSIMLTADVSFYQLAAFFISAGRSFRDARQRRAQARAAEAAAKALAAQQAAPQISVAAPPPEALPAGTPPALPVAAQAPGAPALPEAPKPERNIPITIGGRTISAFNSGELTGAESLTVPMPPPADAKPKPDEPARPGGLGGRLSGLRLPGGRTPEPAAKPAETPPKSPDAPQKAEAAPSGGLRGRLFGGRPEAPKTPPSPAVEAVEAKDGAADHPPAAAPVSSPSPAAPRADSPARLGEISRWKRPDTPPKPAEEPAARLGDLVRPASAAPAASAAPKPAEEPAARLGDLVRPAPAAPAASAAPRPFAARPPEPASKPPFDLTADGDEDELDDEEELTESEELANLPPAQPKGYVEPSRRPDESRSRFGPTVFGAPRPESAVPKPDAATKPQAEKEPEKVPPLAERLERLNAIRSGNLNPPKPGDGQVSPAKAEPEKPAAARSESDKPASPVGSTPRPPGAQPFGSRSPAPVAAEKSRPAAAPAETRPAAERPDGGARITSPPSTPPAAPPRPAPVINPPGVMTGAAAPAPLPVASTRRRKEWKLPDYATLLRPGSEQDFDRESLLQRARVIEDTLSSFGAPGKVVEVNTGPVITQFAVEPDYLMSRGGKKSRVKVSAIAQLDKDLQLALGAKSIRIEAPVPGKGYVGIEVPNEQPALVSLRDVMESDEFQKIRSPLTIALGQSVDGTPVAADLGNMPHLLIAGTTGSGKSVCVNAIIASLLLRNPPDVLKFIMVDPKRVELTGYNGIPHLVAPVVVDLERIVGVLKWVTREMDERYKRFSNAGARNIEDFNKHLPAGEEIMPYIVVIIDELADLMMLAPDETERVITRIAALARATGIHLVIATQRPSVDVVTGLIKANFPARIAFAVASSVDSRVIIDQPGADRLLGRGDMLYMSGDSPAPVRLQGVFVSDSESNNINRFWKSQVAEGEVAARPITQLVLDHSLAEPARPVMPSNERQQIQQAFWDRDDDQPARGLTGIGASGGADDDQEDELYEEAVEMVRRLNKASVSLLQRRLRIGYTRAARLIDLMEERGVVGPAESGSKPREVLPVKD